MLYLLYGADFRKSRAKLNLLVEKLKSKRPEAGLFKLTGEDFEEFTDGKDRLSELISGQGLFGGSYIVILDGVYESASEFVSEALSEMAGSEHIFIFLEGELLKKEAKVFEKAGAEIEEFKDKESSKKKEFNIFSITDALSAKDRKKIWVLYQKALREGVPVEQIHGIVFWQIKTMLLVAKAEPDEKLPLKPFVVSKAKKGLKNWSEEELSRFSRELLSAYHGPRLGEGEIETELERVLLSV